MIRRRRRILLDGQEAAEQQKAAKKGGPKSGGTHRRLGRLLAQDLELVYIRPSGRTTLNSGSCKDM